MSLNSFLINLSLLSEKETALIESEIQKFISKGVITVVPPSDNEFISNILLVPKKTGDFRPVIKAIESVCAENLF